MYDSMVTSLSRVYIACVLVEHAEWSGNITDIEVAKRWISRQPLVQLEVVDQNQRSISR